MKRFIYLVIVILIAVVAYRTVNALEVVDNNTTGLQQETVDPQQCQYPARTTNTTTTCDNSDPCDPANVKGGSGACETPAPEQVEEVTPIQENAIISGK